MAYCIYHRNGACAPDPPLESLEALFDELAAEDREHPDVSVQHESEWSLAAFPGGLLVWENVAEGDNPRHMRSVPRAKVLQLWRTLAQGDVEGIEAEPWQDGYG